MRHGWRVVRRLHRFGSDLLRWILHGFDDLSPRGESLHQHRNLPGRRLLGEQLLQRLLQERGLRVQHRRARHLSVLVERRLLQQSRLDLQPQCDGLGLLCAQRPHGLVLRPAHRRCLRVAITKPRPPDVVEGHPGVDWRRGLSTSTPRTRRCHRRRPEVSECRRSRGRRRCSCRRRSLGCRAEGGNRRCSR